MRPCWVPDPPFKEHVAGLYASVKVFPFILEDVERGSSHTFANGTLVVHTATVVSIVTQTFIAPHTACIVHLAVSHVHHILGFGGGSPIRVIRKFVVGAFSISLQLQSIRTAIPAKAIYFLSLIVICCFRIQCLYRNHSNGASGSFYQNWRHYYPS